VKPTREHATNYGQTYFVTASTWQRRALFNNASWAELFLETLQSYRGKGYLLHEYVVMPDHFHVLITPEATLERAVPQWLKPLRGDAGGTAEAVRFQSKEPPCKSETPLQGEEAAVQTEAVCAKR
jgi:hypothetical protein